MWYYWRFFESGFSRISQKIGCNMPRKWENSVKSGKVGMYAKPTAAACFVMTRLDSNKPQLSDQFLCLVTAMTSVHTQTLDQSRLVIQQAPGQWIFTCVCMWQSLSSRVVFTAAGSPSPALTFLLVCQDESCRTQLWTWPPVDCQAVYTHVHISSVIATEY